MQAGACATSPAWLAAPAAPHGLRVCSAHPAAPLCRLAAPVRRGPGLAGGAGGAGAGARRRGGGAGAPPPRAPGRLLEGRLLVGSACRWEGPPGGPSGGARRRLQASYLPGIHPAAAMYRQAPKPPSICAPMLAQVRLPGPGAGAPATHGVYAVWGVHRQGPAAGGRQVGALRGRRPLTCRPGCRLGVATGTGMLAASLWVFFWETKRRRHFAKIHKRDSERGIRLGAGEPRAALRSGPNPQVGMMRRFSPLDTRHHPTPACRTNLMYYGVLLCVGLGGLVLLLFSGRLQPSNVVGFCIAFSNAYGLVAGSRRHGHGQQSARQRTQGRAARAACGACRPARCAPAATPTAPAAPVAPPTPLCLPASPAARPAAIFLLGFGLVAVPRQLWNGADPRREQRRICHSAGLQARLRSARGGGRRGYAGQRSQRVRPPAQHARPTPAPARPTGGARAGGAPPPVDRRADRSARLGALPARRPAAPADGCRAGNGRQHGCAPAPRPPLVARAAVLLRCSWLCRWRGCALAAGPEGCAAPGGVWWRQAGLGRKHARFAASGRECGYAQGHQGCARSAARPGPALTPQPRLQLRPRPQPADVPAQTFPPAGPGFVPNASVPVPDESDLDIFDRCRGQRREKGRRALQWAAAPRLARARREPGSNPAVPRPARRRVCADAGPHAGGAPRQRRCRAPTCNAAPPPGLTWRGCAAS